VSVAAHDAPDVRVYYYNPEPPVEFGAYGVDVEIAWKGGATMIATGNSFAAPHIAGYAALIRSRHPEASPFEVKAILAATADNARPG
jgi:subtilisin family serine protease